MTDTPEFDIDQIIKDARDRMTVITEDDTHNYDGARQIQNARLNTRPKAVAFCETPDDISFWLTRLQGGDLPVSIRSGGHHHEGMCSNDSGVVLRLSEAEDIEIDADCSHVWLGAAQHLGNVIAELARHHRILPTGGCGSVCVGGLTHGGGWGMSYRTWGLTADALVEVKMVLPDGNIVHLNREEFIACQTEPKVSAKELFWAICGGGGGNFGVVTRFRFRIYEPAEWLQTEFTLQWQRDGGIAAGAIWAGLCKTASPNLNTFARMTLVPEGEHDKNNPAFLIGGRFYGSEEDCRAALKDLLTSDNPPVFEDFRINRFEAPEDFQRSMLLSGGFGAAPQDQLTGRSLSAQGYALQVGARGKGGPDKTCGGTPERHKVSSAFPATDAQTVMTRAARYLEENPEMAGTPGVNLYLSLHGMGGCAARIDASTAAFPWRDKDYMMQVQAWWLDNAVPDQQALDWVEGFRLAVADVGHGAFINFPDRNQCVQDYYGGSWADLKHIKGLVDPGNVLKFDMGIPPG